MGRYKSGFNLILKLLALNGMLVFQIRAKLMLLLLFLGCGHAKIALNIQLYINCPETVMSLSKYNTR